MTWKSTVVISGLTLVATWLGWTSAPPMPAPAPRTTSSSRVAAPRRAANTADIQQEAARLHVRLRDQTDYTQPTRNPFRFVPKREQARVEPLRPVIDAPPPPSGPP